MEHVQTSYSVRPWCMCTMAVFAHFLSQSISRKFCFLLFPRQWSQRVLKIVHFQWLPTCTVHSTALSPSWFSHTFVWLLSVSTERWPGFHGNKVSIICWVQMLSERLKVSHLIVSLLHYFIASKQITSEPAAYGRAVITDEQWRESTASHLPVSMATLDGLSTVSDCWWVSQELCGWWFVVWVEKGKKQHL